MRAESRIALILVVGLLGGLGFFVQQKLQSQTTPPDDDLAEFLDTASADEAVLTPDGSVDATSADEVTTSRDSVFTEPAGSSAVSPNPWASASTQSDATASASEIDWADTDVTPVSATGPSSPNPFARSHHSDPESPREFQTSDLIAQAPTPTSSQTPIADPFASANPFAPTPSPVTTAQGTPATTTQRPAQPVFFQTPSPSTQNPGAAGEAQTNPFEAQTDAPSTTLDGDPFAPVQTTPAPTTGSQSPPTLDFAQPMTNNPVANPAQSTPAPALSPTPNPFSTTSGGSFAQPTYNPQGLSDAPGGDPGTKIYEVAPGDNYWTISRKVYGAGRYFSALAEYNKPRIEDPDLLAPGMIVLIPTPELLDQRYAAIISSPAPGVGGTDPAGFFVDEAGQPMYRVGEADTLSGIAQSCLGRSSRWVQIYGMNRDVIANADALRPGTVLRLPADAAPIALGPSESVIR